MFQFDSITMRNTVIFIRDTGVLKIIIISVIFIKILKTTFNFFLPTKQLKVNLVLLYFLKLY